MSSASGRPSTARDALVFWAIACGFLAVVALLYLASQPLLLAFGGVLFGTALHGLAQLVSRKLGWSPHWSLVGCVAVLLIMTVAAASWLVPSISAQSAELSERLAQAYEAVRRRAENHGEMRWLDDASRLKQQLGSFAMTAAGYMTSAVGALGATLFVACVALYVAAGAEAYRSGILQLVPRAQRDRAAALLITLATTLQRWLFARVVSMVAVGVATSLGLWALDIPLPATLGLIAGVFGFVPNIGPLLSAVPALLVALAGDPVDALYVAALYAVINLADGYALTPVLQKRAVDVPPAAILVGQVVMGALWGVLGVMFATPILACLVVAIRKLYVEPVSEAALPPVAGGQAR